MGKGEVDISMGDSDQQAEYSEQSSKDLRDADTTDDSEEDEENETEQPVTEIKEEKVCARGVSMKSDESRHCVE